MKKRNWKIIIVAMVTLLTGALGACSKPVAIPEYTSDESFRFAAYMPPPGANVGLGELKNNPDHITDENYKGISDCGFDHVYAIYEYAQEQVLRALDFSEKYDLKYLARVPAISNHASRNATPMTELSETLQQTMKNAVSAYKDHPAFAGIVGSDEPYANMFSTVGLIKSFFQEYLPDKEFFVNMIPIAFGGEDDYSTFGAETYTDFIRQYIDEINPDFLSYDKYPYLRDAAGNPDLIINYFRNMEVFAEQSKATGLPFQFFLLTMGHHAYRTPETYADIAFQIYTDMAFGARGAATFTYWTTMSMGENITHGLVDWYGNKQQSWYSMQEVISEVRALEDAYMNFDWQSMIAFEADEDYPNYQFENLRTAAVVHAGDDTGHARLKSIGGDNDYLAGAFTDKDGRDGFMLANASDPGLDVTVNLEIEFNDAQKVLVYKKGRSVVYNLKKGKFNAVLNPGEGQFVIPI
ncbi:MAG: hypothetical protein LBH18_02325 [Spirochaetaceae bacterium]|jgi:hypothetical protein|nr:hypothetical protein [Spirochaetaceae bacterium]